MLVPSHIVASRCRSCFAGFLLLVLFMAKPIFARNQQPALRIPLDSLGFQAPTPEFLQTGSSMLSLDFVDDHHILLTFNARTLLRRVPGDPPSDQDRNVAALLIELPSGHVLARTEWHLHDRGRYLWNLGHGRFLLRIRDALTTFAPLANLASDEPFRQRPFLNVVDRTIGVLFLTSDADLLTVETKLPTPPARQVQTPLFGPTPAQPADASPSFSHPDDPAPVQINFYRILIPDGHGDEVIVQAAGAGRSRGYGNINLTTAGYLDILDQRHQSWAFNFDTFAGKVTELSPFDSTCRPMPRFVSHSEFISFGCHLGQTPNMMGGFNMRGEEMWEQGLFGDFIEPFFVFAPAGGRFALGRVMLNTPLVAGQEVTPDEMTLQNVVVYQAESGKQILKVECSPIERAGQNFALSPDGLNFGVVADGAIEIYNLPPLNKKELTALKLAEASAPIPADLPVQMTAEAPTPSDSEASTTSAQSPANQSSTQPVDAQPSPAATIAPAATAPDNASAPATASSTTVNPPANAPAAAAPSESASGDAQTEEDRKPPTLYTLPSDSPHNQSDNQAK
jgi:hypothetical protein